MTVKEMKEYLADQPDDKLILLSRDAEGNGVYNMSSEVFNGVCEPDGNGFDCYMSPDALTNEARKEGFSEEDTREDGIPCLVFYPE